MNLKFYKIAECKKLEERIIQAKGEKDEFLFFPFDEQIKNELLKYDVKHDVRIGAVLFCETFADLLLKFSLLEVAELLEKGISLLIKDEPDISTFIFNRYSKDEEMLLYTGPNPGVIAVLRAVAASQLANSKGRPKAVISQDFANDYWDWQLGKISTQDIINSKNRNYSFSTSAQFYSLAKRYEKTNDYFLRQKEIAPLLIDKKKRGKVDKNIFIDFAEKHPNSFLDKESINYLKRALDVNTIDFWRSLLNFTATKAFDNLRLSDFKFSIQYAVDLLKTGDYDRFFIRDTSCNHTFVCGNKIDI